MYFQYNNILLSTFFIGWTIERIYFYLFYNKNKKLPINLYTPINELYNNSINTTPKLPSISNSTNISTITDISNNKPLL